MNTSDLFKLDCIIFLIFLTINPKDFNLINLINDVFKKFEVIKAFNILTNKQKIIS